RSLFLCLSTGAGFLAAAYHPTVGGGWGVAPALIPGKTDAPQHIPRSRAAAALPASAARRSASRAAAISPSRNKRSPTRSRASRSSAGRAWSEALGVSGCDGWASDSCLAGASACPALGGDGSALTIGADALVTCGGHASEA